MNESDLLQKLLVTFQEEAEDHLRALSSLLIELERERGEEARQRIVETLFRRMHTLKGAAHAVNLLDVAEICQSLESTLADLKRGDLTLDLSLFDWLHKEVTGLERYIFPDRKPSQAPPEPPPEPERRQVAAAEPTQRAAVPKARVPQAPVAPSAQGAAAQSQGAAAQVSPVPEALPSEAKVPEKGQSAETVRVPVHLLESLLLQAEELVSAKLMVGDVVQGVAEVMHRLSRRKEERSRALDLAQGVLRKGEAGAAGSLAQLVRGTYDLEEELEHRLVALERFGEKSRWALVGMVDGLLEDMKKLQLLPFLSLVEPLPKLVRDLARDLGKEVVLSCRGGEFKIDRRILGELKEPLLHLVRNMVDHGIEEPRVRVAAGKPGSGSIRISLRHLDGNRAELIIEDDGRGIDPARVKGAALSMELITEEQARQMSDYDALQLVFESGLSTSPIITSFSGRGVGLAIVREALERLGGYATVASQPGVCAQFRLVIPLSFAMMRAVLLESSGRCCLIPAANAEQTLRVPAGEIKSVENRETVAVEGEVLSLVRLARILELPEPEEQAELQQVVVLSAAEKRIALAVDSIHEVQEVLTKPLGPQLSRVRNVAGATVLGNGSVVPILNINDLFRSALLASAQRSVPSAERGKPRQISVLVAEDSITSRTLLKNILETSGFRVRTAVDGSDAFAILKSEEFDLVLSDVEMPRMDGFQLTAAIRADARLAQLPVILVTGLETREDRERGIDVGANAYIVKSGFDQGGLIEVIRKLT